MFSYYCRMCGSTLHPEEGATVFECEHCGSKQTLPDAEKEPLIAKGYECLAGGDFDEANGYFDRALAQDGENVKGCLGKLYASERVSNAKALQKKRLRCLSTLRTENLTACEEDAAAEAEMLKTCANANFMTPEEIKKRLSYDRNFASCTRFAEEALNSAEQFFETNRFYACALRNAQGLEADEVNAVREGVLGPMRERVEKEAASDATNGLRISGAYKEHVAKGKQKLVQVYENRLSGAYVGACARMQNVAEDANGLQAVSEEFMRLADYKDSAERAKECGEKALKMKTSAATRAKRKKIFAITVAVLLAVAGVVTIFATKPIRDLRKKWEAGAHVTFGTYPQTDEGTDSTPIEWIVLERKGNNALLISRYALDCVPYNNESKDVTWQTCSLRKWLNDEFYRKAFSATEQNAILATDVDNSKEQGGYDTNSGHDTKDRVFLLSYKEAGHYISIKADRACSPTDYALKRGAWTSAENMAEDRRAGTWWLRSPGGDQYRAAYIASDGSRYQNSITGKDFGVRPVVWVDITLVS